MYIPGVLVHVHSFILNDVAANIIIMFNLTWRNSSFDNRAYLFQLHPSYIVYIYIHVYIHEYVHFHMRSFKKNLKCKISSHAEVYKVILLLDICVGC